MSPDGLISMDWKLNYAGFVLCKKPHEKRPIRGEITFFAKVSKMAIFKGGTKGKFSNMADFLVEIRKAKKIGNTNRLIP